jgi:putative glutamine amidotransferase
MPGPGADVTDQIRPVIAIAWPKPDYLAAIDRAEADARLLEPERNELPFALDDCDGVLLTGGADVDPSRYHADRHRTVEINASRDEYEFALTRHALERDLPVLAICRGVQLLNVVAGGTLIQDLPSERPGPLVHAIARPADHIAHEVTIQPDTCLGALLAGAVDARGRVSVNSRHHQAVGNLAPGFLVAATAPDGVVEAIEKPDATFCVGVQWHPENFWRSGEFASLFDGLISAARLVRARRPAV